MNLFYHPTIESSATEVIFDKEESRHIGKVLRKQEGDILFTTNGKGALFRIQLNVVTPKKCIGNVISSEIKEKIPVHIHLAVAPTKLNDRYEWFLEKATEIGVSEITPIICDHSERKVIKHDRYNKIIQSAMKQSLKTYLPKLNEAISFGDFLEHQKETETVYCIAHCEENTKKGIKEVVLPSSNVLICIGPEGDFSSSEIEEALKRGFEPVSLGSSRLRTETAAIVACHSITFINDL